MPSQSMPVSTLSDVIRLVQHVFSILGDGTPIMVGEQYLRETGPGSAPRVVFVPEDRGSFDAALKLNSGYIASWTHVCKVTVRGAEPGDDPGRFEPAYLLAARVTTILKNLDPGHVKLAPGNPRDNSPLNVDGPGADIVFQFAYSTNIAQDPAVLRAIATAMTSVSPPNPDQPGGDSGQTLAVAVTSAADRT